jgi:hypothetical protein
MSFYNDIITKLVTACSSSDVSTAAGISNATWTLSHVFTSGRKYIAGQNRGRVPFINIWRQQSDYAFDAVSSDFGGEVKSLWRIEVVVGKTSRVDERTNEQQAQEIAEKIIKSIKSEYNLQVSSHAIGLCETHPFGLSLIIDLTLINTSSSGDL